MNKLKIKIALYLLKSVNEKEKREVLRKAVSNLFNAVSPDEILKENPDGTISFEGKVMTSNFRKDLREQAKLLPNLLLWKVLQKDINYQLQKKMWKEANCDLDVVWWQLTTFLWDVINDRINKLQK